MISTENIFITPHRSDLPTLELAPFTADDLRPYIPFSEEYKRYSPLDPETNTPYVDQRTPEEIVKDCEEKQHFMRWGIFVNNAGGRELVGSVAVSDANIGTKEEPNWDTNMQEIHTGIFSGQWHRRGIGTLSKLAVASYVFDQGQALELYAQTSQHNLAAQGSLYKAGFSHVDTYRHFSFQDQEMTTYWVLTKPRAQQMFPKDRDVLAAGWNRYLAARQKVTIDYKET